MPTVLRANCIIVGDSATGKSSITQVFHSDGTHFPKNYSMTCGAELLTKQVTIPESNDSVELFIYDSAGKEMYSEFVQQLWNHPSMVMVVFDVTNNTSFHSCAKWLERVRSQKPEVPFPGVLVGNKTDLSERRSVTAKEAEDFAASNGLEYFDVSAKEMQSVDQPFLYLAQQFQKMYKEKVEAFKNLS